MTHDHWRDLEDLGEQGWSVAVTGHEDDDGEPDGVQLDAARSSLLLGEPPTRVRVLGATVAEATPKLLRQIARLAA